jgi:ATP-dependent RNA helicase DHX8/PRP22
MESKVGSLVGYSVRFDENYSKEHTRIKYVTDGMLLRECILDPLLMKYSVIILDEAHERSVNSDTLLALVKGLIQSGKRPDLKLIVMSATLDSKKFSSYLNSKNILSIKGRSFPIEVYNTLEEEKSYIDAALITILQIHLDIEESSEYENGDILVFLPGQEDIEDLQELLYQKLEKLPKDSKSYEVFPLFSSLPNQEQMRVFKPLNKPNCRKIILATNIAETSITIKNIKYVIDSGFCKLRKFISKTGVDSLLITKISKNSAIQRSGRAGREAKGKCFRLYTEEEFSQMEDFNPPEVLRINLKNIILDLKAIGVEDLIGFDYIDRPSEEQYRRASEDLIIYGALDKALSLTDMGKKMSVLPLEPMYSLILIVCIF